MAEVMRSNRVGPTFAQVAQLGERQTEDLNVPGSSPGLGTKIFVSRFLQSTKQSALMRFLLHKSYHFMNISPEYNPLADSIIHADEQQEMPNSSAVS